MYGHLVVLLAGLATAFSPCLFPALPLYLVFMAREGRPLATSILFTAGLVSGLLGYTAAAAVLGGALLAIGVELESAAAAMGLAYGALTVVMALAPLYTVEGP